MSKDLMNEPAFVKTAGWLLTQAPAFAGAVVSLAFIGELSQRGRLMAVIVGAATAMYLAPALSDAIRLFWPPMPATFDQALRFLISLSAMGGLPKVLKILNGFWGDPLGLLGALRGKTEPKPEGDGHD